MASFEPVTKISPVFRDKDGNLYRRVLHSEGMASPTAKRFTYNEQFDVAWFEPFEVPKPVADVGK